MNDTIHCFGPIAGENARVLVLGTMPSVRSLGQGFYYAHPRNAFWPIMEQITGKEAETAEKRRALALESGIAIWDVLSSCRREGSLDSAIRDAQPNDIAAFLRLYPGVRAVFCNGSAAHRLYRKHCVREIDLPVLALPSTSPAYTMPFAQKLALWSEAFALYGVPFKEIP